MTNFNNVVEKFCSDYSIEVYDNIVETIILEITTLNERGIRLVDCINLFKENSQLSILDGPMDKVIEDYYDELVELGQIDDLKII